MPYLTNPQMRVKIFLSELETISGNDYYMDFEITKDLEEETNEAELHIYNLDVDTRSKLVDSANMAAPIEIHLSTTGDTPLTLAFSGELETVRNTFENPGYDTHIVATSQQRNHRATYVDNKTFPRGTSVNEITDFFIETIGLARGQVETVKSTGILLSQSFSGPAFALLKRFCRDNAMHCWINDGVINVTSIYTPDEPVVREIKKNHHLTHPRPTTREDAEGVEMMTIAEGDGADPQAKKRKKKKKKKQIKGKYWVDLKRANNKTTPVNDSDYVEYEAVDTIIEGMDFELILQPDIQPDTILFTKSLGKKLYRAREVIHHGETESFNDWTTELETDLYEDTEGVIVPTIHFSSDTSEALGQIDEAIS